jgi:hypothetical protein
MPKDGDGAGDAADELGRKAVVPYLDKVFAKKPPRVNSTFTRWNRVGLVQDMVDRGFYVTVKIVKACLVDLKACLEDEDWMNSWRSTEAAEKSIKALIEAFEAAIKDEGQEKRRRKARSEHAGGGWKSQPRRRPVCYSLGAELVKAKKKVRYWSTMAKRKEERRR